MLLNPSLLLQQLLEGLLACTPRRPNTASIVAPSDPGVRAARVGGFTFGECDPAPARSRCRRRKPV